MEPVTHFLFGAVLSRAGFNRKTPLATLTMTIAAEASDIDVALYFLGGPAFGFAHHRGITHSVVGVPFVAAATVGGVWLLHRFWTRRQRTNSTAPTQNRKQPEAPNWPLLFLFACIAGLSHILLDFTNNYGVKPWAPFSYTWVSWDIVYIVEPLLYVILGGALLLPAIFGLVTEDIGVRSKEPRGRGFAIFALILVASLWGFRDYEHREALAALNAYTYDQLDPIKARAYPYPLNPFRWFAVVETDAFFRSMDVDTRGPEIDPEGRARTRYKAQETEVSLAAKNSYLGRHYLSWAAFPVFEVESHEAGDPPHLVRFYDMRFMYPGRARPPLRANVELDRQLNVIDEYMGEPTRRERVRPLD